MPKTRLADGLSLVVVSATHHSRAGSPAGSSVRSTRAVVARRKAVRDQRARRKKSQHWCHLTPAVSREARTQASVVWPVSRPVKTHRKTGQVPAWNRKRKGWSVAWRAGGKAGTLGRMIVLLVVAGHNPPRMHDLRHRCHHVPTSPPFR